MTDIFKKKEIPIVYAVDDNYAPFLCVSLKSVIATVSKNYFLKVYILNTGLSEDNQRRITEAAKANGALVDVEYVDVADRLDGLKDKMHLRDYYTNAIYYRIFIPSLFPQYDKILYLDCDIVLNEDISKLYNVKLGKNIAAAVHEEAMSFFDCFGVYSEEFLGVPRMQYFNSGLLLINTAEYNRAKIETEFINLMLAHKFEVAPDQDYLNVLLLGRTKLLDVGWNKTPIPGKPFPDEKVKLIHYKLNFKPWHYEGVKYEEFFWKYARKTPFYDDLIAMREGYSEKEKRRDELAFKNLQQMAWNYIESENNYIKQRRKAEQAERTENVKSVEAANPLKNCRIREKRVLG